MIWRPKPGQRVRLHYRKSLAVLMPHQGKTGTVILAGKGPGPINAAVALDDGVRTIVPRGNLYPANG